MVPRVRTLLPALFIAEPYPTTANPSDEHPASQNDEGERKEGASEDREAFYDDQDLAHRVHKSSLDPVQRRREIPEPGRVALSFPKGDINRRELNPIAHEAKPTSQLLDLATDSGQFLFDGKQVRDFRGAIHEGEELMLVSLEVAHACLKIDEVLGDVLTGEVTLFHVANPLHLF